MHSKLGIMVSLRSRMGRSVMSKHKKYVKIMKDYEDSPALAKSVRRELKREERAYQKHRSRSKMRED